MDSQFSIHFLKKLLPVDCQEMRALSKCLSGIPCCHIVTKQIDLLNNCNDLNCKSIKMLIGKMHQSHIYQNRSGADVRARDIGQSQTKSPHLLRCNVYIGQNIHEREVHCISLQCIALHFVA